MADKDKKTFINATLAGIADDTVRRFGSGIKEHLVALNGVDRDIDMSKLAVGKTVLLNRNGTDVPVVIKNISGRNNIQVEIIGNKSHIPLNIKANDINGVLNKRGLASIAKSKVNPDYQYQNLKQQAGFAAEVEEVARQRAEEAIAGKKPKTVRTDDIPGHVNDQRFDITREVDANGNPVPEASAQMKFVGSSPEDAVNKMLTKQYQRYHDDNVKIMVPKDYYPGMKAYLHNKIESLEKQITEMRKNGTSPEQINSKIKRLKNCKMLQKNLQESKVTNAEAMEARTNPTLSTAKDIVKLGHRAGVKQAEMGAAIGGSVSIVRNLVSYCKSEKTAEEALVDIAVDTGTSAAVSYGTAAGASVLKAFAQNSTSSTIRTISKTNAPAYIAVSVLETGKTMTSYVKGDIDSSQCLNELGEKGYTMVNSAFYAAVGQAVIPIPVVGAMVGSMVGCVLSTASYDILQSSMLEAKVSEQQRIQVEYACKEHIAMLQEYKAELEHMIAEYMAEQTAFFDDVFTEMLNALKIGDTGKYIAQTNKILVNCGKKPLFSTQDEFNQFMESDQPLKL